jgi:hypothetical protein
MKKADVIRLDGLAAKRATHDRRASADVGYRVWNPFETELETNSGGQRDEVAKGFTRALDVSER